MNDHLEDHLRMSFARREPPPGFAGRVMARVPARRYAVSRPWMSAIAAALILALFAGSWQVYRERQLRIEAERASAELIYALELTSVKLQETRSKLFRNPGGTI